VCGNHPVGARLRGLGNDQLIAPDRRRAAADKLGGAEVHDVGCCRNRTEVQAFGGFNGPAIFARQDFPDGNGQCPDGIADAPGGCPPVNLEPGTYTVGFKAMENGSQYALSLGTLVVSGNGAQRSYQTMSNSGR